MKALRQPSDPAKRVKDFLAAQLLARGDPATAGLVVPSDWQPHLPAAVVVFDDGGPTQWPVSTSPMLRITVWADGRTRSRTLAGWCSGWLYCARIPGISHVGIPTSLTEDLDPDNGGHMAGFVVTVKARTLPL